MNRLEGNEQQYRITVALVAVLSGCGVIGFLTLVLPEPEIGSGHIHLSALLLDRASETYPLTIQNIMWLMFFFGLGELWIRFHRGQRRSGTSRKGTAARR